MTSETKRPIFVLGSTRSGTSILVLILRYLGIPGENEGHVWGLYQKFLDDIEEQHQFIDLGFRNTPGLTSYGCIGTHKFNAGAQEMFKSLVEQLHPQSVWFDKTPTAAGICAANSVQNIYPGARFVYIQRNGVENLCSARIKFPDVPFEELCMVWVQTVCAWQNTRSGLVNRLEIDHRDLVETPESVFSEFVDFLGLDNGLVPELCEFASCNFPQRSSTSYVPLYLSAVDWPDSDKALFMDVCRTAMERCGYSRFLDWNSGQYP